MHDEITMYEVENDPEKNLEAQLLRNLDDAARITGYSTQEYLERMFAFIEGGDSE